MTSKSLRTLHMKCVMRREISSQDTWVVLCFLPATGEVADLFLIFFFFINPRSGHRPLQSWDRIAESSWQAWEVIASCFKVALWGACVSSAGPRLLSPIKLDVRGWRIVRKYEPMTSKEARLCFPSLQRRSLHTVDWHWCVGLSAQDIMALNLLFRKKKKEVVKWNRITVKLTWAMCTVGWRWCLRRSLAAAREKIHKSRNLVVKKQCFWGTLDLCVSISKNKQSMMAKTWQTREVKNDVNDVNKLHQCST